MREPARAVRVLVVGPRFDSPRSRGGMATIVALMRDRRDARFTIRTVATFVDGTVAQRAWTGVTGMIISAALVLARRTDVLHVHLAHRGSVVRKSVPLLAARAIGMPAVIHAHSYDFAGWFDDLPAAGRAAVRWALRADLWLVLGEALAKDYAERMTLPSERVEVLYNPVRTLVTGVAAPDGATVRAVFLGRQGERKGSYDLVAALAALPSDVRAALRVVAAGDGEVEQVRAAAAQAGLAGLLDVRGWVDATGRDELLARAELFLLPSHDEGLPMALLEAMGAALAPVTTPVGAIGEVVTDGVDGLIVPVGDPAALAGAISELVRDPDRLAALRAGALARAGTLGIDAWFDRLVSIWTRPRRG